MLRFSTFYLPVLLTVIICNLINADSGKRIEVSCIDEKCTEPISEAKAKKGYFPNEDFKLRLKVSEQVEVYGKSEEDLWYVKANGKFGYVPATLLKEERIFTTSEKLVKTFHRSDENVILALKKRSEDNSRGSDVESGNSNERSSRIRSTESALSNVSEENSKLGTNEALVNNRQENNQSLTDDTNVTSVFDATEHSCDAADIFNSARTEKSNNSVVGVNNNSSKEEDGTLKNIATELNDTINTSSNRTDILVTKSQLKNGNIDANELVNVTFNDNSSADNSLSLSNNQKKNGDVEKATENNVGAVKITGSVDKRNETDGIADNSSSLSNNQKKNGDVEKATENNVGAVKITGSVDKRNETDGIADNSSSLSNNQKKNGDVEEATENNVGAVKITDSADKRNETDSSADNSLSLSNNQKKNGDVEEATENNVGAVKITSSADKINETDAQKTVDSPINVNVEKSDDNYDDNSQSNKDEHINGTNESADNKMYSVGSVVNQYINNGMNLSREGNDNLKNISVESNDTNITNSSNPEVLDTNLQFNEKNENNEVAAQSNVTDIGKSGDYNSPHSNRKQGGDTKDATDVQPSHDDAVKTMDKVDSNKIDEKRLLPEATDSSEKVNVIKSEENNLQLNKNENTNDSKEPDESDKSISSSYIKEEKQNSDIKDTEMLISQESGASGTADVYSGNETISEDRNNFVHNGSELSDSESFESLGSIDNIETVSLRVGGDKQDNIVNDLKNIDGVIIATADVNEVLKTEHQGDGIHKGQTDYYWDMFYFSLHEFEDILYIVWEQLSLIGQVFTNKLNEMQKILVNNGEVPSTASVSNEHSEICQSSGELSVDQINDCFNSTEASRTAENLKMADSERNNVPVAVESCDFRSSFIPWSNIFIAFTVFAVFIFCVLYYYLQKNVYNYRLIKKINELESRLFILNKEIVLLDKSEVEDMMIRNADKVISKVDLINNTETVQELEAINAQLEKKVEYLEAELERVTSSALEIHQLLESSLSYQNENKILLDNLESLKKVNEQQATLINTLKVEKQNLVEESELIKEDSKIIKKNVEKLRVEYNVQTKRNLELAEKCELLKLQLDEKYENSRIKEENYKLEIDKLRKNISSLELSLRKQRFKKIERKMTTQAADGNEPSLQNESVDGQQADQSGDELASLQSYNAELTEELSNEKSARLSLEDSLKELTEEVKKWEGKYRTLELEKSDLGVKLQVLTDYFKDKEANFRKEMESKNSMWVEKENSESLFLHKITLLQAELDNIKTENEALKKEIFEQEKSYKMQLANMEQKSRDHWFALRQAERKYKESEREAANLRNKILVLETNKSNSQKTDAINNDNVVNGVSKELIPDYFGNSVISTDMYGPSEFIPLPPPPLPNDDGEFFPPEPLYSPERLSPLGGRRPSSPPPPPLIDPDDSDFLTRNKYPSHIQHHDRNSTVDSLSSLSTRRSTPPIHRRINQFRGSVRHRHADQESLSSGLSENSLDKEIP